MKKVIVGLVVALLAVFAPTAAFAAEGQFTVDEAGITLPAGQVIPDGGHINVNSEPNAWNMHFQSKCIERTDYECYGKIHNDAQYIGQSFIPWSAFSLTAPFCVTWVQVGGYDYHFGEQQEDPICVGDEVTPDPEFRWNESVVESTPDCVNRTVTITTTRTEESAGYYKGDDGKFYLGGFFPTGISESTDTTRDATEVECPTPIVEYPELETYTDFTCESIHFWHSELYDQNGVTPDYYQYWVDGDVEASEQYSVPTDGFDISVPTGGKVYLTVKAVYGLDAVTVIERAFVLPNCDIPEPPVVVDPPVVVEPEIQAHESAPAVAELAKTGSSSMVFPIAAGLFLIALSVAVMVYARRKKNDVL